VPFYQTKFFLRSLITIALVLLVLVTLLLFLVFYYHKKTIFAINQTKSEIAMDLHDEAGSILTRLYMLTRSKKIVSNEREQINNGLKEALFSIRTYMDSLTSEKSKINLLCAELKEIALLNSSSITIKFMDEVTNDTSISTALYRDIKLCFYEIISNNQKHSSCQNFTIKIVEEKNNLLIHTIDDGKLTNIDALNSPRNGIRNIKKRVQRNKGEINYSINNITGYGLELILKFPLS
jgi:signal transduction histidine kinase